MSSVTLGDIYWEMHKDPNSYEALKNIIVVPRKMVEMIIKQCVQDDEYFRNNVAIYASGIRAEAMGLKLYAEYLCDQFEEGEE